MEFRFIFLFSDVLRVLLNVVNSIPSTKKFIIYYEIFQIISNNSISSLLHCTNNEMDIDIQPIILQRDSFFMAEQNRLSWLFSIIIPSTPYLLKFAGKYHHSCTLYKITRV